MYQNTAEPIYELGITELIGADDQVDQNDYSASVGLDVGGSGEILSILLVTGQTGTGAIQEPVGKLLFFDADPAITAGDTSITLAEAKTVVGVVDVAAGDWVADDNEAVAYIVDTPIPYHQGSVPNTLYVTFLVTGASGLNSAAGDDETLHINLWYRKDR